MDIFINPQWQYNNLVIPFSISIIFILFLIAIGYRQRQSSLGIAFILFMICTLIWITTSLLEIITLNLNLSLFFADISFLGSTFFPVIWLATVMIYIGQEKRFYRFLPFLLIVPIVTNIIIWTNSIHHLWRLDSYRDLTTTWFPITEYNYGFWFYTIHYPFSILNAIVANFLLIQSIFIRKNVFRTHILIMLIALNFPLLFELLHRVNFEFIPNYNAATLVFPISGLLLMWVISQQDFLDLTPIARDIVVESMDDIMLVLDYQGRIIDLNRAASNILFNNRPGIIGQNITRLLQHNINLISYLNESKSEHNITRLKDRMEQEYIYEVTSSTIKKQGNAVGRLLLMRDITERKQSEQVYLEQLKQIAILEERQRLASELHDSVNQTLFAAGTLANLLPMAIEKKPEKIAKYASDIQEILAGTSAQMRLVLMELHPDALTHTNLDTIIKHLCDAHTGMTGTPIIFSATSKILLNESEQMTFYRVAQEALHNISKHAEATQVHLNLVKEKKQVQLIIKDNGIGFDPHQIPTNHFGLSIMSERASTIGASLIIESDYHIGTTIKLCREIEE